MRVPVRKQRELSGFTLVEMAIVLVIIGIILAGVMKGRDIVRSAQHKEFAQSFGNKWVTMTQTYYDKIGQHIIDGSNNAGTGIANGLIDGRSSTTTADKEAILLVLQAAGVDPCNNIKTIATGFAATSAQACQNTKDPFQYIGDTEYMGRVSIYPAWGSFTDSRVTPNRQRNYVSFVNCPIEFAKALDTLVDGEADGANGFGVYLGNSAALSTSIQTGQQDGAEATARTPAAFPTYSATVQIIEFAVILDY